MAASALPESTQKIFTAETLRLAAKQSQRIHLVPLPLRRAIKKYLRENDQSKGHMNRKVMLLSQSFCRLKETNLQLAASASRELVEDPHRPVENRVARWKIKSAYGDIGLRYSEDETIAYVASRMPAVHAAIHRVLREVKRRLPDFTPEKVLDFGAGPSSALWAMREVWPKSIQRVNLIEPSKEMQRASQTLLQNLKGLPLIHSYDSIQELNRNLEKKDRQHDLVVSSYALGEIPSMSDRITIVRQLWDLTGDTLVLLEPGTPQGSKIITQMRSYLLWMEKRRARKMEKLLKRTATSDSKSMIISEPIIKSGSYVVAPCPHDGKCPLENSSKYCHFVQRLERTSSQRIYKRSKGEPLRGYEDEKFCYVAIRRGDRPQDAWPLDGMEFETLKEKLARRNPEDLIIDYEDQFESEEEFEEGEIEDDLVPYQSDVAETGLFHKDEDEEDEDEEEEVRAGTGSGWGRIVYMPLRRGRQVQMDVCRATNRDGSQGEFKRVVVTQSKNPTLHFQAKRSIWGDLWPC